MADIFKFFNKMNSGDYEYIDKMEDDEVKDLSAFVLLMWVNGAQSNEAEHIILTDMYCNEMVFSLSRHPRLLLKLFVAANSGFGSTRYKFKKSTSKDESASLRDIAEYYGVGLHEAKDIRLVLKDKELKQLREEVKLNA